MRRTSILIAAVTALALALAPGLAEARAGGGGSFGSRGGMTWSAPPSTATAPNSGQPLQRSMTPNNPSPGYSRGCSGYGYRPRASSGFMSGLMGGLIGAGIGGLLFGHGFLGGGLGFGGFLGFLLQIFLLVWLVRFLIRLFRGQSPAFAGGPACSPAAAACPASAPMPLSGGGRPRRRSRSRSAPATTRPSSNCCRPSRRRGPRMT